MNDQRNINLNSLQEGENNFNQNSSPKEDVVSKIYKILTNIKYYKFRSSTMKI